MLENKKGIIFGVANKRSIAWATAQALHDAGATLAFTYQGERLKENVESLTAGSMSDSLLLACDVTNQAEVDATFKKVGEEFGKLDFLIHSIAYAPREALDGEYLDTSRDAFLTALEISAYSLPQLARAAAPLMTEGGSVVCMSYYGAEKVVAGYNVMGVAKAALEASTRYLAHDLGPKTATMLHLAAATPNFAMANDCTYYGLADDIITEPFAIRGGRMKVPHGPGLGVTVDEAKLKKYLVGSSAA